MNTNGQVLAIAVFLLALAVPGGSVRGEEDCLLAPSGPPPVGSQWRYRTDQIKQRKCWHLVKQGEDGQTTPATAAHPAADRPDNPPDHLQDKKLQSLPETPAGLRGSTTPANTQSGLGDSAQPAWPAPPPTAADEMAWPDPPAAAGASNVPWPDPPAPAAANNAEEPTAPILDRRLGNETGSKTQVAASAPISDDKMFLGIILVSAAALVVVGFWVPRWMSKRSNMGLALRAPRPRNIKANEIAKAGPHDDTRQALQKLLQILE
jgi:hypothetical protein